jgi:hypothetical protein
MTSDFCDDFDEMNMNEMVEEKEVETLMSSPKPKEHLPPMPRMSRRDKL